MFECVVNISEGRVEAQLDELRASAGRSLRDLHSDRFHNRSVFTLINEPAALTSDARALLATAYERLDLRTHEGVHPRFGVVDVVPFVALEPNESPLARSLRDETAQWIANSFDVPVFLYGPVGLDLRTLPEVRRGAFTSLTPDFGPASLSPARGATAVGERPILVAWNLWLRGARIEEARAIAASIRRPEVRALAFTVGDQVQVSCNLIAPQVVGPGVVYDDVVARLSRTARIERAELVGLAASSVLEAEPRSRWEQLGLSADTTIEVRVG